MFRLLLILSLLAAVHPKITDAPVGVLKEGSDGSVTSPAAEPMSTSSDDMLSDSETAEQIEKPQSPAEIGDDTENSKVTDPKTEALETLDKPASTDKYSLELEQNKDKKSEADQTAAAAAKAKAELKQLKNSMNPEKVVEDSIDEESLTKPKSVDELSKGSSNNDDDKASVEENKENKTQDETDEKKKDETEEKKKDETEEEEEEEEEENGDNEKKGTKETDKTSEKETKPTEKKPLTMAEAAQKAIDMVQREEEIKKSEVLKEGEEVIGPSEIEKFEKKSDELATYFNTTTVREATKGTAPPSPSLDSTADSNASTSYSRESAVAYAGKYWNSKLRLNHDCEQAFHLCTPYAFFGSGCSYPISHGGDAANFVSQCLLAGFHPALNKGACRNVCKTEPNMGRLMSCLTTHYDWERICGYNLELPGKLKIGDIIAFHDTRGCSSDPVHMAIVVKLESGFAYIASHDEDVQAQNYKYFFKLGSYVSYIMHKH